METGAVLKRHIVKYTKILSLPSLHPAHLAIMWEIKMKKKKIKKQEIKILTTQSRNISGKCSLRTFILKGRILKVKWSLRNFRFFYWSERPKDQGNKARKVTCFCVFSAYILKPVLSGLYRPGTAISNVSNLCTAEGGDQNKEFRWIA